MGAAKKIDLRLMREWILNCFSIHICLFFFLSFFFLFHYRYHFLNNRDVSYRSRFSNLRVAVASETINSLCQYLAVAMTGSEQSSFRSSSCRGVPTYYTYIYIHTYIYICNDRHSTNLIP